MTHPALASLSLAKIHERGRRAHIMGVPYFGTNTFVADASIRDFDAWAAKSAAWWSGWLQEDRSRDAAVRAHLSGPRLL